MGITILSGSRFTPFTRPRSRGKNVTCVGVTRIEYAGLDYDDSVAVLLATTQFVIGNTMHTGGE